MSEANQVKRPAVLAAGSKHFWSGQAAHNTYVARPRYEDSLQDVLKPEYWRNHCGLLRNDDFIDVLPEGNEWYARLLVINADRFAAKVKVLIHTSLCDQVEHKESSAGFKVDRAGRWWRVIRIADQSVVKSGLNEEAEALAWIAENTDKG